MDIPEHEIEALCSRIDELDSEIRAFLPEPGRPARLLRETRGEPRRGPRVGVKDIFRVDYLDTRAGSMIPPANFVGPEAEVVWRLRSAGAWIVGKTQTTEFAMLDPGPTANPHDVTRTPGGSSSGSAAAVAAGMVDVALGTQTVGSVIRPAAYCGVVGFKPSFDRIPTAGVLYAARSVDHVGLFAPDIAGVHDAAAIVCDGWRAVESFDGLPRLGVPDGAYLDWMPAAGRAEFEERIEWLAASGLRIERIPCMDDFEAFSRRHSRLVAFEFAREHAQLFERYGDRYRPCARDLCETGAEVPEFEAEEARASCLELRGRLDAMFDANTLDAWISPPATGIAPVGLESTGSPAMNLPWTHAGLPCLTIPTMPGEGGMPLGLQLAGRFGGDEELLAFAARVEVGARDLGPMGRSAYSG